MCSNKAWAVWRQVLDITAIDVVIFARLEHYAVEVVGHHILVAVLHGVAAGDGYGELSSVLFLLVLELFPAGIQY